MNLSIEELDELDVKQDELLIEKQCSQIDLKKSSHKAHNYKRKNHKHGYNIHKTNTNFLYTQIDKIKKEMIVNDKKIRLLESKLQKRNNT
jgi:hypothetical protein